VFVDTNASVPMFTLSQKGNSLPYPSPNPWAERELAFGIASIAPTVGAIFVALNFDQYAGVSKYTVMKLLNVLN
jgi:hypothetical protein